MLKIAKPPRRSKMEEKSVKSKSNCQTQTESSTVNSQPMRGEYSDHVIPQPISVENSVEPGMTD